MVSFKAILGCILLLLVSQASSSSIHGCYLFNATNPQQQFQDFKLDTYTPNLCSHIFFSYARIKDDFTMDAVNPGYLKWGVENKFYNQLVGLKSRQPGLKTILSLGNSRDFKKILIDGEQRQTFVQSAASFAKQFDFDGVDIHVTQSLTNKKAFTEVTEEFKKYIPGKLIIVSVPANHESLDSIYDVPSIARHSNFVNILTTESNAKESNLLIDAPFSNEFDALYSWVSNGLSKDKLVIGMNILAEDATTDANALINLKSSWMKENGFGGAFVQLLDESKTQASTVCCDHYPDTAIVDNDLVSTLAQLDECCDFCANLTGCFGWTWDNTDGGKCWFKTTNGPGIPKTGSTTGLFCENRSKIGKKKAVTGIKNRIEL